MSLEDRLDKLERRLTVLETLVRQLAAPKGIPVASAPVLEEVSAPTRSPVAAPEHPAPAPEHPAPNPRPARE